MKKKELLNNIGFVLIVVALIVILVFQKNTKIVIFAASFGLLIYGLMTVSKNNVTGLLTCVLAVSLAISGSLYFFNNFTLLKAFTFMMSSTVFFMMVLAIIFAIKRRKMLCSKYNIITEAEVMDLIVNPNTEARFYQPYYRYEVDGNYYYVSYPEFINKHVPNIGDKTKIRVDEKDKESIYFEESIKKRVFDISRIIFFLIVSLIIMIGQFL